MVKNAQPPIIRKEDQPKKKHINVAVMEFTQGLSSPPTSNYYSDLVAWDVNPDGALLLQGDGYCYIYPSGMWFRAHVKEIE